MNILLHKPTYSSLLLCLAIALVMMPACKKDKDNKNCPVITGVRNYEASPNDTSVQTVNTGQWIVVTGSNLKGVAGVYFGSVAATINTTLFTDESIVVQIPSIPFQSVPGDKLNEITVVSDCGVASFKINIIGEPMISYVRNYSASPDDTVANAIYPGQQINLIGYSLKNATSIAFQGVQASLPDVVYTDSSAIVKVPANLSGGDATLANTITYTTAIGTTSFSISIIGPPIITRISNENPNAGDSVYFYGNNFFSVQDITFAGTPVTSFSASGDGKAVGFVAPSLSQSGPAVIITQAGTFTSAYNVNDITTGAISNFEWSGVFHWDWWGGASLESGNAAFPGNSSQYLVLKTNPLDPGAGDEFSTAIRIGGVQWLPAGNLADPLDNWALKFETNIPGPWNGSTLSIKSSNNNYRARYEPWQISTTATAAYSSIGWKTVTVPLSAFRKNDATLGEGKGAPVASIIELLGSTGKSDLILYMHNYGSSPAPTGFNGAFDNFRIVRR